MSLRIIFMGTPEFATATLRAIADAGHDIAAVYTQPPRPAGRRGLDVKPSPVQTLADELRLYVRTPVSLKSAEEQTAFGALNADVAVVVAYGMILPKQVLNATRHGALNAHASLLPRWRGAAPIQRAIMAGDSQTGIMIMKMDEGLDTGPVALTHRTAIDTTMTAGDLHDRLMDRGAELMVEALAKLEQGKLALTSQSEEGVTYAAKITKDETRIDWARPANAVDCHIRGLSPFPGAWCEMTLVGRKERVKLLRSVLEQGHGHPGQIIDDHLTVACGKGAVRILELQKAGSKPVSAAEFLRGANPQGDLS